jgi:glucoamylase
VDRTLCDYVAFSEVCQNSADAASKFFLARFTVDGGALTTNWDGDAQAYRGLWSEQKDGPALQSLSFVAAWPYLDADARTTATRIAQRNLDETVKAWGNNGGMNGPWEDMSGPSLFARAAQIRLLQEVLATNALGLNVSPDVKPALDGLSVALEGHWSPDNGCYLSIPGGTPSGSTDASEYDPNADVIMAHVYGSIPCTDPKLLATAAKLRAAFVVGNHAFPINADDQGRGLGPLVGRYPSDNYDGDMKDTPNEGQPWAICTANIAQLYYCVAKALQTGKSPGWDDLTAAFFTQVDLDEPTVNAGGESVSNALITAADKMLRAIMFHSAEGHLSEQFDKVSGYEKSVEDLTWSYASFMSAVRTRP